MFGAYRIDGLAIVSVEGNIADHTGYMPNSLKLEADQALYAKALADAAVVIHGKLSHEGGSDSSQRRRLVMTRRVANSARSKASPTPATGTPPGPDLPRRCPRSARPQARSAYSAARTYTATFWRWASTASSSAARQRCRCPAACLFSPRCARPGSVPNRCSRARALALSTRSGSMTRSASLSGPHRRPDPQVSRVRALSCHSRSSQ